MKLTTRQKNTLKKHQESHGHTKQHMDFMKRKMREGMKARTVDMAIYKRYRK